MYCTKFYIIYIHARHITCQASPPKCSIKVLLPIVCTVPVLYYMSIGVLPRVWYIQIDYGILLATYLGFNHKGLESKIHITLLSPLEKKI